MKLLPEGDGNLLIRTDFAAQHVWDDLCALIAHHTAEGLLTTVRIVDDPAYEGMAAEQLLGLVPQDGDCVYLAVADGQDRTLLIVNVDHGDEEHGSAFRAPFSELASIDANLSLANMEFSEYREAMDDGVHRGMNPVSQSLGAVLEGRPALSELLPGDTLRLGSLSSRSGAFLLVNQDDGDVVIYRAQDGAAVWRTGTPLEDGLMGLSNRLVLRESGELVVFAPTGAQEWNSGTRGRDVRRAVLGDDGRLVLIGADGDEVWSSDLGDLHSATNR